MNDRYFNTFQSLRKQRKGAFCPFAVLGHPTKDQSFERIRRYIQEGADILELGIPFSDPVADGPTIQLADDEALCNGITINDCFDLIQRIRSITSIPIGILVYANIVYQYGVDAFYRDLHKAGADSILIADVPLEEIVPFSRAAQKHHLHQIMIVSENTDLKRLKLLEEVGSGFFYVISAMGVTGERKNLHTSLGLFLRKLKHNTSLPLMIGFGISTAEQIYNVRKMDVDGIIIGSALVKTPIQDLSSALSCFSKASHEELTD